MPHFSTAPARSWFGWQSGRTWRCANPIRGWGKFALIKHQRYAHARQFNRANRALRKLRTYLGRVIYTQDPGRALISGKCNDIGAIVMQQLRGLAARAPYFANGSAANLREVVDFYDRRFNIQFTEQEKQDLVNFLSVL